MKNRGFNIISFCIFFLITFGINHNGVFAVVTPGPTSKSNATSGPARYNNNFNTFTPAQQRVLNEKFGGDASRVTADHMCGDKCAAILNAVAQGKTLQEAATTVASMPNTVLENLPNAPGDLTPVAPLTPVNRSTDNILGIPTSDLRTGNLTIQSIPDAIVSVISTLLGVAGTVAIFSLIYHAVQMQINSGITGDSSGVDKAKKGMIGSLIGFVIAISAWFLVTQAVKLIGSI